MITRWFVMQWGLDHPWIMIGSMVLVVGGYLLLKVLDR